MEYYGQPENQQHLPFIVATVGNLLDQRLPTRLHDAMVAILRASQANGLIR